MANHSNPVPTWLNEDYIEKVFRTYYNSSQLEVKQVTVTPGSNVGDNYVYQILRIKSILEDGGKTSEKFVIGKLAVETSTTDALNDMIDVFKVEAEFYDFLLPKLNAAIKNVESAKKFAPDCYFVDYEKKIIIMEDLKTSNFELQERKEFLSKEQAMETLTRQASLHGASYKVLQKDPSIKLKFDTPLLSSRSNKIFDQWFDSYAQGIEDHVESYGLTTKQIKMLKNVGTRLKKENFEICSFKEGKLNLLLHGDCWKSNMMFHNINGIVNDVILLDYQGVNYNSVAIDLNYFLFTSVKADVLASSLDELLSHYISTLRDVAPEIPNLTLTRLKEEFNERLFLGMAMFCIFRPLLIPEVPVDTDKMIQGVKQDEGFSDKGFIADLHKLLPLFEKVDF